MKYKGVTNQSFARSREPKQPFRYTIPEQKEYQQSILNSVQKVEVNSNYNSMKSLKSESPKNIHDKINFINQLYDQLNRFESAHKSPLPQKRSPNRSVNRSTDTPEQLQPVQPMQLDASETVQHSRLWTFHHNSRDNSYYDNTTEVRAFEQAQFDADNSGIVLDKSQSTAVSKGCVRPKNLVYPKHYKAQEREQMINELFEDLQGRSAKSAKSKNFVAMNKKPESLSKRPHQTYEKMLETIDRRLQSTTTMTTPSAKTPSKPKRQPSRLIEPKISTQQSQATLQNQSRVNLQQRSAIKQDYKRFLEEINTLGEKLCKTSGSLNRTMNEIRERSKHKY